jgi:hypothetical protein
MSSMSLKFRLPFPKYAFALLATCALPLLPLMSSDAMAQQTSSAKLSPQLCPPGGCGGGGGGGGGTVPYNYGLTWTNNLTQYIAMGGVPGRQGPGADVFAPTGYATQFYVAYTSSQNPVPGDQDNDQYVYISTPLNSGQQPYVLINPNTGVVESDANPSLLGYVNPSTGGDTLLLSVNSQYRQGISGYSALFLTTDGHTWNLSNTQFPIQPIVDYSPSMATDGTWIYLGLRNAGDHTLVLCRQTVTLTNASCKNFPGSRPMNFNPSLAVVPGSKLLLIGYEEYDNTHALRVFTSADQGQTINENTNITTSNEDTTSSAPSIASHNGAMYIGFRTNDSNNKFLYRYSTDGINWSARNDPNYTMGGAPTFVDGSRVPGFGNTLYNFFSSNDSNHALVQWFGKSN